MNILVTGGAGFIGSCFIRMMVNKYPGDFFVNLDALTYAGNLRSLDSVAGCANYRFVRGDICDRETVSRIFDEYDIEGVVNFAAESHVDRSIIYPEVFLRTNIMGTAALLDCAKKHWAVHDDKYCRLYRDGVKFLQVSTDEVYGALGAEGMFTEDMPLMPNSPYSASKASADLMVRAYHETFGLPVNITRCSNNYGEYQFPEKLIPLMISNCRRCLPLPVYGDGMQVRDWLHVSDHCEAVDTVLRRGASGEVYNVGGNNERANIEIVKLILEATGRDESLIKYVRDRPGHDRRYAIDNTKITSSLGWTPKYTFDDGMRQTVRWYLDNEEWVQDIVSGDYMNYYEKMYGEQ